MAVVFIEAGGSEFDSTTALSASTPQTANLYNGAKSGTVTVDTTVKEHGHSSLKHDTTATPTSAYVARAACLADAGRRISIRMRFTAFGASAGTGILRALTSGAATVWEVRCDSAGKLRLYAGATGSTLIQTGATTLNTSQWYRIAVAYTITSASVSEFRVYLDGTLELTGSNPASQVTGSSDLRIGWTGTAPGSQAIINSQDLYVDNGTDLADPGDIRCTAKFPAGLGDTNAFDTAVGTGTNRWDRVDERAVNTANRYTHAGTGVARENYTVEAASVGDDDLTGATILDWAAWAYWSVLANAGNAASALVRNGTDVAQTSVAASSAYQVAYSMAGSTSYPSANNVVGYKSTGTTVDTLLAECGVVIAYLTGGGAGTADAPLATVPVTGQTPSVTVAADAPLATVPVTGFAPDAVAAVDAPLATVPVAGFAPAFASTHDAPLATIPVTGLTPDAVAAVDAPLATIPATALTPSVSVAADVPLATVPVTGFAPDAVAAVDAPLAVVPVVGFDPTTVPAGGASNANAPLATVPVTALTPGLSSTHDAPLAAVPVTGFGPSVAVSADAPLATVPVAAFVPDAVAAVSVALATIPVASFAPAVAVAADIPLASIPVVGLVPTAQGTGPLPAVKILTAPTLTTLGATRRSGLSTAPSRASVDAADDPGTLPAPAGAGVLTGER